MKNNRLSGLSSFGYLGTNAAQPPNVITYTRAPNQNDTNYAIGDFWIHVKNPVANDSDLYVLMGLAGGIADWDLLSSGNGTLTSLTGDDLNPVLPVSGNIDINGKNTAGSTVQFTGSGNTLSLNLADIAITNNMMIGKNAGNFTLTGTGNLGVGVNSSTDLTTGDKNTCVGIGSGTLIQSGSQNTIIGYIANCGPQGDDNICIGQSAGGSLSTNDSSNILIDSTGVTGDNLTIRIGNQVQGKQRCFIQGIRGITTGIADAIPVLIDSAHQLGTVSSSEKYKQDIRPLADLSEIIYKLEPKFFHYKKHPEIPAWGLIAEEVDKVFPQLCVYNDEGKPETVKYHDLIPLLLNEIIRLNKRLTILEEGNSCC